MLKLDESFRDPEIFITSLISLVQILDLSVKIFFLLFLVDILSLGSAYFANPDPGSQNLITGFELFVGVDD